jgi:cytochrome c-type protein NapC
MSVAPEDGSGGKTSGWSRSGVVGRLWRFLCSPSTRYSLLTLAGGGFVAGIVFWGGFNTAMEATNTLGFCISCHEMRDTVYKEYQSTIHYANRTGVRAVCSDCHVPKDWVHKVVRKVQASGELYGKIMGVIDTPEKFEAKRLELAKRVWATMEATDSRECRNCHSFEGMNPEKQKPVAAQVHQYATTERKTCIECHKGIAHKMPAGS